MTVTTKNRINPYLPLIIVFIVITVILVVCFGWLENRNIDTTVILCGNILLFALSMVSFRFHRRALLAGNTQAFLRHVYSAILLKLFVCVFAAFAYIYAAGKNVNTGAIFSLMFLYMVYTYIEISGSLKQSSQISKKNE